MDDLISRQAAVEDYQRVCATTACADCPFHIVHGAFTDCGLERWVKSLPSAEPQWIPVSERLPEDLEEVNITFTNLDPEPYYDFIKGKRFTGSAVFYKGEWYWYSSVTVDVLKEYGRYESEKIDEGIKIIAWQPLPEPYKEEE